MSETTPAAGKETAPKALTKARPGPDRPRFSAWRETRRNLSTLPQAARTGQGPTPAIPQAEGRP